MGQKFPLIIQVTAAEAGCLILASWLHMVGCRVRSPAGGCAAEQDMQRERAGGIRDKLQMFQAVVGSDVWPDIHLCLALALGVKKTVSSKTRKMAATSARSF